MVAASVGRAQTPTISSYVIDSTPGNGREPAIATTRTMRLAVYYSATGTLRYAVSSYPNLTTWVAKDLSGGGDDPSVAVVDSQRNIFVIATRSCLSVKTNRYHGETDSFDGWVPAAELSGTCQFLSNGIDKSWIVSRGAGELLVTFSLLNGSNSGSGYSRSMDGGLSLDSSVDSPNVGSPWFCTQPTVSVDGQVYIAYPTGEYPSGVVQFMLGKSGSEGTMVWEQLLEQPVNNNPPAPLSVAIRQSQAVPLTVPALAQNKLVPNLVADPTDDNLLYLVHHDYDAADESHSDMNIYCVRLDRNSDGWWTASGAVRVNNDSVLPGDRPDQVIPAATVDARGRVHVIFYDNRGSCPGTACTTPPYSFDQYYAISADHGLTFANYSLTLSGQNAAIYQTSSWDPKEYNGIALYNTSEAAEIWTSYYGKNGSTTVVLGSHLTVSF
jgi:hypothetical protein